jgi:hypothetical protein
MRKNIQCVGFEVIAELTLKNGEEFQLLGHNAVYSVKRVSACHTFHADFFLGLALHFEDVDNMFLRNVG